MGSNYHKRRSAETGKRPIEYKRPRGSADGAPRYGLDGCRSIAEGFRRGSVRFGDARVSIGARNVGRGSAYCARGPNVDGYRA